MNIAELYVRDPRTHTDKDIDTIIEDARKAREKFLFGPKPTKKKAPKTNKIAAIKVSDSFKL